MRHMTREQRAAATDRCRAAGLAYLAVPGGDPGDDDLPGLLVPDARDRSEHEFVRVAMPLETLRGVVRQALARIDVGERLTAVGATSAGEGHGRQLWRARSQRLREERAALRMAQAFLPRSGGGEVEYGASCLGGGWGEGVEAALHAAKRAEAQLLFVAAMCGRQEVGEDEQDRETVRGLLAELAAAVEPVAE